MSGTQQYRGHEMNVQSARLLIALTSLIFAGCGSAEDRAIAEIESLGGRFVENYTHLDLSRSHITDAGLEHVKGIVALNILDLSFKTPITDAGLEHLKGLTSLKKLGLHGTQITDAGLEHLKGLTSLEELDLRLTQITDAGLEHLKWLTGLEELRLGNTRITDAGLGCSAPHRSLQSGQ